MERVGTRPSLRSYWRDHLIVGDGAMGTQLYSLGIPIGACAQELNISQPELVASVHRSYYEAGARLLETNTFGAHRPMLERYGLGAQLEDINRAGVRLARAAGGDDAYVAGTIGSIAGVRLPSELGIDLEAAYAEQARALLAEEPDALLLETFLDVSELELAIGVIRTLTTIPVMAQLSLIEHNVTRDGIPVHDAFLRLRAAGADVVGLNCRYGPADIAASLERAGLGNEWLVSAYPNAGLLSLIDGEYTYPSEPAYFGAMAQRFRDIGVRIFGGCCGTTPAHIRAIADALRGLEPVQPGASDRAAPAPRTSLAESAPSLPSAGAARGSLGTPGVPVTPGAPGTLRIHEKVRREFTVIVELDPPKELDASEFLRGARALQEAGADAVTLADNSLAVTRMSNLALGALMKADGVEPLLHISCRDRNLIGQQSHLMGLHALGIDQVLAITGDPSRFGDFPGATSVFDMSSFELIRMIKQLNAGVSSTGRALKNQARFVVGAAFNPHVPHLDKAIRRLERKVEAGADFIMTQPIYDAQMFAVLSEATRHIPVPLFVGIMPLTNARNAEFLHNEVPGIRLTDEVRARMAGCTGPRAREEGIAIARELIDAAMDHFNGLYLITPLLRFEMTVSLTQYIHAAARSGLKTPHISVS